MSFYNALNASFALGMRPRSAPPAEFADPVATWADAIRMIIAPLLADAILVLVPEWPYFLDGSFWPSVAADPAPLLDIYVVSLLTVCSLLLIFYVGGLLSRSARLPVLMLFVAALLLVVTVVSATMALFGAHSDTPTLVAIFFGANGARRILPISIGWAIALGIVGFVAVEGMAFLLFALPQGSDLLKAAAARH